MDWKKWAVQLLAGLTMLGLVLMVVYGMQRQLPAGQAETAVSQPAAPPEQGLAVATFAGGCFWCMESPFDKLPGVKSTTSGYTGGQLANPSYELVSAGSSGYAEAVRIVYDPKLISYGKLLEVFWHQINPTTPDQQFVDVGSQYRTAIFYHDESQKAQALKTRAELESSNRFGRPIVTEIVPAGTFWPAEAYHQDFYQKNPEHYENYREHSGRDQYLDQIWGAQGH